jgi:hypothetical protein
VQTRCVIPVRQSGASLTAGWKAQIPAGRGIFWMSAVTTFVR